MSLDPNSTGLNEPQPAAFTVNEFLAWARISRSTLYKEVDAGRIPIRKCGRRTLILRDAAESWLRSLPEVA